MKIIFFKVCPQKSSIILGGIVLFSSFLVVPFSISTLRESFSSLPNYRESAYLGLGGLECYSYTPVKFSLIDLLSPKNISLMSFFSVAAYYSIKKFNRWYGEEKKDPFSCYKKRYADILAQKEENISLETAHKASQRIGIKEYLPRLDKDIAKIIELMEKLDKNIYFEYTEMCDKLQKVFSFLFNEYNDSNSSTGLYMPLGSKEHSGKWIKIDVS